MNEVELIENKELRVEKLGRIEVLDRVGSLLLLPNKDVATSKQVSEFYNVRLETLKSLIFDNKEELLSNGMTVLKGVELKEFKRDIGNIEELKRVPNLTIFTKQTILKIAFLLTESEVALKIRNLLKEENPKLYTELSKENQLRFKKYETEIKNYLEFSYGKENLKTQVKLGKYSLDFILFNNIHIEVDENGHESYNKEKEEIRKDYILKNTEYYTIRYNPKIQQPYEIIKNICDIYDNIGYPQILC